MDENTGGDNEELAHFAFILSTMVLLILFMNMIIAIMSERFAVVQGNAELYKFQQQISIINDYLWLFNLQEKFKGDKYILVVKPEEVAIEDDTSIQTVIIEKIKEESSKIIKMVKKLDVVAQRKLDNIKDNQEKAGN